MALAATSSLEEQGFYALVSNYGGLVARLFFQPIDESSRNFFGKVLIGHDDTSEKAHDTAIIRVKVYLCKILHCYLLATLLVFSLAPAIAPDLFQLMIGSRWTSSTSSSDIHKLLSAYCYYIPFLAINGIMEAFVSSTATPSQLRKQSVWMGFCSIAFFGASYGCLVAGNLGATGIVCANIINMFLRIAFAVVYMVKYFGRHDHRISLSDVRPSYGAIVKACVSFVIMPFVERQIRSESSTETNVLIKKLVIAAVLASSM